MASLLIIGGSGFFGKSFLDVYQRGDLERWKIDNIKILSRRATNLAIDHPCLLDESVELINSDIGSCKVLPGADYVVHAAASTDASRYLERPLLEKQNILRAITNYCSLAPKYHKKSKILYVSSGAVYGQQPDTLRYINEEFNPGPVDQMHFSKRDYATAKREAEKAIAQLGQQGCDVSIARCFAFIGKYLPREQHFAIGNFIEDGLNGKVIQVKADKLVYRSYMHSDDLVEWLMTILSSSNIGCPIFNVGSDEEILIDDLASIIAEYCNVGIKIYNLERNLVDRYIPSTEKAQKVLGLRCMWTIRESIKHTISAIKNG